MPVTTPVVLIVATDTGAILQVPPLVLLLNVMLLPEHMGKLPEIGPGAGFTVTIAVAIPQVLL
jgi:hypothetical protein